MSEEIIAKDIYKELSDERKRLQKEGLLPKWYTTAGYQLFKKKYEYQTEGRSVRGQFERIAKAAAKHLVGTKYEKEAEGKFFDLFWKGWVSPSTPVLANMGTSRGLPVSCSGSVIDDSILGFYKNRLETAILTKHGFGTSAYLGKIRPRGADISVGGKASGVMPVFKGHVQDMREVSQGSARRGAWAGYIELDHPDVDEIIDHISAEPDDCNIGWNITDDFICRLDSGDPEAIRRFQRAMKMKMITGRGYFFFVDKVNRQRPQMYKDKDLTVKSSNLCVVPETLILTDAGHLPIGELEGQKVNVWNGEEFTPVDVVKTGTNQKIVRVTTDSGFDLECTEYHKFFVANEYNKPPVIKRAHELVSGDKLMKFDLPTIEGSRELPFAYDNGFFSGDGCVTKGHARIYLYGEKRNLKKHFGSIESWYDQDEYDRSYGHTKLLKGKFFVPDSNYTIESRLEWLAGLCDSDGTYAENDHLKMIQIGNVELGFLKRVQLMLQELGVHSKITKLCGSGPRPLPDGKGGIKDYECRDSYRLLISAHFTWKLLELGLKCRRLDLDMRYPDRNSLRAVKVVSVLDEGRFSDTYCFHEPKREMGVFNGILTSQCAEIALFSDEEHSFSCVLSAMNVSKWDEWKDTDAVFWATIFLDCVAEELLQRGSSIEGIEKVIRFTKKGRALGLGQCGLHTLFQNKMIPFESLEAQMLSQQISKRIWDESLRASQDMAGELGEPEWCRGYGVRNTHRIACMPTKSTALLMSGVSEGINPDPAMVFTQKSAGGDMERINPSLLKIMKERGKYTKTVLRDIGEKFGSVQHVDWLTEEEKRVFKTAFEIDQFAVLRLAAARQKFVDQGQSLNLFFSAEEDPAYIAKVHAEAFHNENILGLYYIYTQAGVMASKEIVCEACQ